MASDITPGQESAPVACILTEADLATQSGRWERLIAGAMTDRAETEDGLRISFRPEPSAEEELRALVAVETRCCAWATWTVERTPEVIVLEVRSAAAGGITALHAMLCQVTWCPDVPA